MQILNENKQRNPYLHLLNSVPKIISQADKNFVHRLKTRSLYQKKFATYVLGRKLSKLSQFF